MQNKKTLRVVIAVFAILAAHTAFAQESVQVSEPKKSHVLVVGRLAYKKPIDLASRKEAFEEHKRASVGNSWDSFFITEYDGGKQTSAAPYTEGYFFSELKPNKNGTVSLDSFTVGIFAKAHPWHRFSLPAGVTITIPDEAVYVYVGTFEYELDYALRPIGFAHLDEYDAAQKQLSRELGKNVTLYRGALEFKN